MHNVLPHLQIHYKFKLPIRSEGSSNIALNSSKYYSFVLNDLSNMGSLHLLQKQELIEGTDVT